MSWTDAARYSDFGGLQGRPRSMDSLISPRSPNAGGFGLTSSPEANYSIIPLSEQSWQANGAPFVNNWSDMMSAQAATDIGDAIRASGGQISNMLAGGSTGNPGGGTTAGTGKTADGWDIQNQWNGSYEATSSKTGVPANLIKAVQGKETGKFWQGPSGYGNLCPSDPGGDVLNPGMGCVATNTGIYEETAKSYGLDFNRIATDPNYAIYAMGVVLNGIAQSPASNFGGPQDQTVLQYAGWEGVAGTYFGGSLVNNHIDGNGQDSVGYINDVMTYVDQLGGLGVGPGPSSSGAAAPGLDSGTSPIGSISNVSMMWGGVDAPISQDLGSHDGETYNNDPHIYDYAKAYGFDGHPGIDYALPRGTPIASPISGTVINTGGQFYTDGAGGIGEIRLQAPNGDIIILGHMASSNVKIGDTITVGEPLGTSGQSDPRAESAHLHLEVRVLQPDGSFRIADPRTYFGGSGGGETTQQPPAQPPAAAPPPPAVTPVGAGGGAGRSVNQQDPYAR